jgi:hypothetical protein
MRFPYRAMPTRQPVPPLGGARTRHYPIVPVVLTGPAGAWARDCRLDSGADDTIFPHSAAQALGIDLTGAPLGSASQVGGAPIQYPYAPVTLRISDGQESCEWIALVGFAPLALRWPLLGQTAFLQFFDATLLGARRETVLTPNASFPGRHTVH